MNHILASVVLVLVLTVSMSAAITQAECKQYQSYAAGWFISPYEAGQYIGYGGVTFGGRQTTQADLHACKNNGYLPVEFANPIIIGHQMGSNLKWRLDNQQ